MDIYVINPGNPCFLCLFGNIFVRPFYRNIDSADRFSEPVIFYNTCSSTYGRVVEIFRKGFDNICI